MNRKAGTIAFWIATLLPAVVIICIVVVRKAHPAKEPSEVALNRKAVTTAQAIFEDREFVDMQNERAVQNKISELLLQSSLTQDQKRGAIDACWGIMKAYSNGDWELFKSVRIPTAGYDVDPKAVKYLQSLLPEIKKDNALQLYEDVWRRNFSTHSLFTKVAFQTNAIDVQTISAAEVGRLSFAKLGFQKGQRFVQSSPPRIFDYTRRVFPANEKRVVLGITFFAKQEYTVSPLMIAFAWSKEDLKWIPVRLSQGLATKPITQLKCF